MSLWTVLLRSECSYLQLELTKDFFPKEKSSTTGTNTYFFAKSDHLYKKGVAKCKFSVVTW